MLNVTTTTAGQLVDRLAEHVNRRAMNLTGVNDSQSVHVNNSRMYADPSQLFSMHDPFRRLSNKLSVSSWSVKHRLHVILCFSGNLFDPGLNWNDACREPTTTRTSWSAHGTQLYC